MSIDDGHRAADAMAIVRRLCAINDRALTAISRRDPEHHAQSAR